MFGAGSDLSCDAWDMVKNISWSYLQIAIGPKTDIEYTVTKMKLKKCLNGTYVFNMLDLYTDGPNVTYLGGIVC